MLVVISPAKTLKTDIVAVDDASMPVLLSKSKKLVTTLNKYKPSQLSSLMGISAKLAQLNYERYQQWNTPYVYKEALTAIYAFRGEVFNGLDIDTFSKEELDYTNQHLRILSGLYGVLKPKDAILAYRLEMGTKLEQGGFKNLYKFWGDIITQELNKDLKLNDDSVLVNLASQEYFKSINTNILNASVITPVFKEAKNGNFKVISIFAKKARGMMSRFIMKNRIIDHNDIKHFDDDGYYFNDKLSTKTQFVFTR